MQVIELPPSPLISLASASVTPESRASQRLARSSVLGEVDFFGGSGLQSVALRLPALESIGDKATVFADLSDSNGNTLQIAFTFEKVGENIIRALTGTGGAGSTFDIFLGEGGAIRGFDTTLNGSIDTIEALTLSVQASPFDALPLKLRLIILSIGGDGDARKDSGPFLRSALSLNTQLAAQSSTDPISPLTPDTSPITDTGTGGNGPFDFALGQGQKNGF